MIKFTDHAERKLKQRNLSKDKVRKVLKNPEFTFKSYSDRRVAYKRVGKLYLAVVFVEEGKEKVVLTAHWEDGFKPEKAKKKG